MCDGTTTPFSSSVIPTFPCNFYKVCSSFMKCNFLVVTIPKKRKHFLLPKYSDTKLITCIIKYNYGQYLNT